MSIDCLNEKEVKTRKPHICHYCQKTIPKGSMAHIATCVSSDAYDGIYDVYQCEECWALKEEYPSVWRDMDDSQGDGYEKGCLIDFMWDYGCQVNEKQEFLVEWERWQKWERELREIAKRRKCEKTMGIDR